MASDNKKETFSEQFDVTQYFENLLNNDPHTSDAVAAIQALILYIQNSKATTLQELLEQTRAARQELTKTDCARVTSVSSGCELFLRFITMTSQLQTEKSFDECKRIMVERGQSFLQQQNLARARIAQHALSFVGNDMKILTHARSRVVYDVLKTAREAKKHFTVYCTTGMPNQEGLQMAEELKKLDINVITILDSAVGYVMEKMDFVLVGAEGVCQNGGIINKIGTFTVAVCAKDKNKAFYVAAESVKFAKVFPLNQGSIPQNFKYQNSLLSTNRDLTLEHPRVDYTPPDYIKLMFTDLGILTPSAVSDELIKLYI